MKWFEANPHGPNPGLRGEIMWESHQFGRRTFASSFARGGFASTAFAPTAKEAFVAPWRRKRKFGSPEHIANLRKIQAAYPNDMNIAKTIQKAERGIIKTGVMGNVAKFGLGAAFVALPAFVTPGSGKEKARAVAGGVAGFGGWVLGAKAGAGAGAAIGSAIPGIGTAVGAAVGTVVGGLAGAIGADEGFQALTRIPDRMVERERARRNLNWRGDPAAFMTRSAHTMRQQSLQAMNRGMMNARSMLGREGIMLHQ